jgi:hypothetical protein
MTTLSNIVFFLTILQNICVGVCGGGFETVLLLFYFLCVGGCSPVHQPICARADHVMTRVVHKL